MTTEPPEPTLTLLIATLGQRRLSLIRLLGGLMPQVDAQAGRVGVMAYWDNGQLHVADKRQALVEATTTDYLCFIDDDDTVSEDYIAAILGALDARPDFVGFWMMVYEDGRPQRRAELSLRHDGWFNGPQHYCRDITHENPMRTAIAQRADFRSKSPGEAEDTAWAGQLRGLLKTEVFIDRVLYHYWYSPSGSTWTNPRSVRRYNRRGAWWAPPQIASRYFSWHPDSLF